MTYNFAEAVDLAMNDPALAGLRPVVEKEILHYDILFALESEGLLRDLVFQGGTALRLMHGAPRFSEDLDFVGGVDFTRVELARISTCVMDHIGGRYGLEVSIKEPREMKLDPHYFGVLTDRWQISVVTSPARSDVPRQKIKLEVANVPAHTQELRSPVRNYNHLPDGYADIMVPVETLDEVFADKIVSLAACTTHPRHRDVWDLRWLKQNGAKLLPDLVSAKIADYHIADYQTMLDDRIGNLHGIVESQAFSNEMSRFVAPATRVRTFAKPGFTGFLAREVSDILKDARSKLYDRDLEIEFAM